MVKVRFAERFRKQYNKAGGFVRDNFDQKLKIFLNNPFDLQLNNHKLIGKFKNLRSINITGDWRALYLESFEDGEIVAFFTVLGTHSQLYR